MQLDRGLYGVLIVEDPAEPGRYDREAVIVLDDWTDGIAKSPGQILARLLANGMDHSEMPGMDHSMGGMHHGMDMPVKPSGPLGDDTGDIRYPLYLVNGRRAASSATLSARPGERVRLRIVNAAADTAFRLALGGHRLTVTHADGFPVLPVSTDALLLAMGERYDAILELDDGVFPLVAVAEGTWPPTAGPSTGRPCTEVPRWRCGRGSGCGWCSTTSRPCSTRCTCMDTFQVRQAGHRRPGPRTDTVIVRPGERVTVDFDAANPGRWMLHCHNAYHQAGGMMTELVYAG